MLRSIFLLSVLIGFSAAVVPLYKQCGGWNYSGDKDCGPARACIYVNDYWHECKEVAGCSATSATTNAPSPTTAGGSGGGAVVASSGAQKFIQSKFKHGRLWRGELKDSDYDAFDYVTIWIGYEASLNYGSHGVMIDLCKRRNKIPLFYAYIIAFEARRDWGLADCDVSSSNSLCTNGANYVRSKRQSIIDKYRDWANKIAGKLGKDGVAVFLIEPDFWQYHGGQHGSNNPGLTGEFMRDLFKDLANAIKSELPNAVISWDISAWIGEQGMRTWWGYFKDLGLVDIVHTSGGQARGNEYNIKPGELAWKQVVDITGKKIIADCGYGVAGNDDDSCDRWNWGNAFADRVSNGVVALSQTSPRYWKMERPAVSV